MFSRCSSLIKKLSYKVEDIEEFLDFDKEREREKEGNNIQKHKLDRKMQGIFKR